MGQSTNRIFFFIIVGLLTIIFFLGKWGCSQMNNYNESQTLNSAQADTLHHYKDKDGMNHAIIKQFRTDKANDFLALETQDKFIKLLQDEVKKNKSKLGKTGSVTIAETFTEASGTVATTVISTTDPKSPIYESEINLGGWVFGKSIASKDSTSYTIQTKDTITMVLGEEKTGFLKLGKRIPFADITNKNPYSTTKNMRSYQVEPVKRSKFKFGLGTVYGFTFLNGQVGWGGTVGASIIYSPF